MDSPISPLPGVKPSSALQRAGQSSLQIGSVVSATGTSPRSGLGRDVAKHAMDFLATGEGVGELPAPPPPQASAITQGRRSSSGESASTVKTDATSGTGGSTGSSLAGGKPPVPGLGLQTAGLATLAVTGAPPSSRVESARRTTFPSATGSFTDRPGAHGSFRVRNNVNNVLVLAGRDGTLKTVTDFYSTHMRDGSDPSLNVCIDETGATDQGLVPGTSLVTLCVDFDAAVGGVAHTATQRSLRQSDTAGVADAIADNKFSIFSYAMGVPLADCRGRNVGMPTWRFSEIGKGGTSIGGSPKTVQSFTIVGELVGDNVRITLTPTGYLSTSKHLYEESNDGGESWHKVSPVRVQLVPLAAIPDNSSLASFKRLSTSRPTYAPARSFTFTEAYWLGMPTVRPEYTARLATHDSLGRNPLHVMALQGAYQPKMPVFAEVAIKHGIINDVEDLKLAKTQRCQAVNLLQKLGQPFSRGGALFSYADGAGVPSLKTCFGERSEGGSGSAGVALTLENPTADRLERFNVAELIASVEVSRNKIRDSIAAGKPTYVAARVATFSASEELRFTAIKKAAERRAANEALAGAVAKETKAASAQFDMLETELTTYDRVLAHLRAESAEQTRLGETGLRLNPVNIAILFHRLHVARREALGGEVESANQCGRLFKVISWLLRPLAEPPIPWCGVPTPPPSRDGVKDPEPSPPPPVDRVPRKDGPKKPEVPVVSHDYDDSDDEAERAPAVVLPQPRLDRPSVDTAEVSVRHTGTQVFSSPVALTPSSGSHLSRALNGDTSQMSRDSSMVSNGSVSSPFSAGKLSTTSWGSGPYASGTSVRSHLGKGPELGGSPTFKGRSLMPMRPKDPSPLASGALRPSGSQRRLFSVPEAGSTGEAVPEPTVSTGVPKSHPKESASTVLGAEGDDTYSDDEFIE